MAEVVLKNLTKKFGNVVAVNNVNMAVNDKEFCVLVGPSGCGKTTMLRMVAGLEEATNGEIWIDGKFVNDVLPKDRDMAMVFQNYALYPHMKTYHNMAFGLKLRKYKKSEIDERVYRTSEVLNIQNLLWRYPRELSGGQRQRVAVGRSIVRKPKVFLFDEPLSNLDAKLRVEMRLELKKLHERLQSTIIYVTHDQVEAMTLGDKIVVMKDGVIQQIADPLTLYTNPINKFVAGFIGSPPMNFINCKIIREDESLWLDEGEFKIKIPQQHFNKLLNYVDTEVILGIRPENIYSKIKTNVATQDNTFTAMIDVIEPLGSSTLLYLVRGKSYFIASVDPYIEAKAGEAIEVVFDTTKIHIFDKDTEKTII